jgi:hypothetical protein
MEKTTDKMSNIEILFHIFTWISFALVISTFFSKSLIPFTVISSLITGILSIPAKKMYGLIWFATATIFFLSIK